MSWAVGDAEGSSREFEFELDNDDYCTLEDIVYKLSVEPYVDWIRFDEATMQVKWNTDDPLTGGDYKIEL
jgi:hypothetical protein